jgi:hypothetical protein
MIDCDRVQELLPWYVTGNLDEMEAGEISAHVRICDGCRSELSEIVWLRHGMTAGLDESPSAKGRTWRRIAIEAGIYDSARIDVGSLVLGFRLGFCAGRRGSPVRASLRVMGRNIRIVGRKKEESCKTVETN